MTGIPQKQSIIETETLRIYTKIKFSKKIESVLVTTVKKKFAQPNKRRNAFTSLILIRLGFADIRKKYLRPQTGSDGPLYSQSFSVHLAEDDPCSNWSPSQEKCTGSWKI